MPERPVITEWDRDTVLGGLRAERQRRGREPFQLAIADLASRFAAGIRADMPDLDAEQAGELLLMVGAQLAALTAIAVGRLDVVLNLLAFVADDLIAEGSDDA